MQNLLKQMDLLIFSGSWIISLAILDQDIGPPRAIVYDQEHKIWRIGQETCAQSLQDKLSLRMLSLQAGHTASVYSVIVPSPGKTMGMI